MLQGGQKTPKTNNMNKLFLVLCLTSVLNGARFTIGPIREEFIPAKVDSYGWICDREDAWTEGDHEKEFVMVDRFKNYRPVINKSDFDGILAYQRFPAAIRQVSNIGEVRDGDVNSDFIRNHVIDHYDITTIFALYDLEMMNKLHTNDKERVLENYLKQFTGRESNRDMARMAHSMYVNEFWNAFKLIIDEKFSFDSVLHEPIYFKDLRYLMMYAAKHFYPDDFMRKVFEVADPEAVRRYNGRCNIHYSEEVLF